MNQKSPLIVALDVPELEAARRLLDRLADLPLQFKIGKELFTAAGPAAVELVHRYGRPVFLDAKYHDIPNTVAGAVRAAARLGVWMLNVHALGGRRMLEAAREAVGPADQRPLLLGVTVLTSLSAQEWATLTGSSRPLEEQVEYLAELTLRAGLDGVVASPRELERLRERFGDGFRIVTPGVRPVWAARDDQERVRTPAEALDAGADYLVVGRPIAAAPDPRGAAERILDEIAKVAR